MCDGIRAQVGGEEIGSGSEDMAPEQQGKVMLGIAEGFTIDRYNDTNITLAAALPGGH